MNTLVHGINAEITEASPTFDQVWPELLPYFENQLLVAHNAAFDMGCINSTLEYYSLEQTDFRIDCTYQRTGENLDHICQAYDIHLDDHHDALCDARACAEIYLKVLNQEVPDLSKIKPKEKGFIYEQPGHERISGEMLKPDLENGDPNSPFYEKKVVLTGVLQQMTRHEAAEVLKNLGADIDTGITKKTHFVVTGKDPGPSKIRKVKKYNEEGCDIKILCEEEFLEMLG
jgi:DNA polymerase-3 subunit epsilon